MHLSSLFAPKMSSSQGDLSCSLKAGEKAETPFEKRPNDGKLIGDQQHYCNVIIAHGPF